MRKLTPEELAEMNAWVEKLKRRPGRTVDIGLGAQRNGKPSEA